MAITYTSENKFPLPDTGCGNYGAILNGIIQDLDIGWFMSFTAGEGIAQYDWVYLKPADGKVYKAKADAWTTMPAIGIAPVAISNGAQCRIQMFGWIEKSGWAWNKGEELYLSAATAGATVNTAPDKCQILGFAKTATKIFVCPESLGYNSNFTLYNQTVRNLLTVLNGLNLTGALNHTGAAKIIGDLEVETLPTLGKAAQLLDQNDEDQAFTNFEGTEAADTSKNISTLIGGGVVVGPQAKVVSPSQNGWQFNKMVLVEIGGVKCWIATYLPDNV